MLRRKQVMIFDWLDDFIHAAAKKYDLSYSEVIRIAVCYHFSSVIAKMAPDKYTFDLTELDVAKTLNEFSQGSGSDVENRRLVAEVYAQAKKILDARLADPKAGLQEK